ncbi:MAG: SusC/RagA family TonB-linked outer membrane protein [Prolixibacteraceae bacterium]|nr:SusC/RagA family TonB-linked outer membrane protein [Prolixibacteraceae bacterium]
MKLSIFIICLSVLTAVASGSFSQTTKVSLSMRNSSIEEVLRSIEDQSEYRFFYTEKFAMDQKVNIDFQESDINEILDTVFKDTNIRYRIVGRQIALFSERNENLGPQGQQQKSVTGKVTDESGQPLPGVSVVVKGTTNGTVTDVNGKYTLSGIPADATLAFSFVGMKTREAPVGSKQIIDVVLQEETIGVDEVVVVGYGTQKRENLTGAIDQINASDIAARPSPDIILSLQGLMPGLNIQPNTGDPRSVPDINIRGFNSINGGSPLILVDGIEGELERVNPADIESVTVLKDAASAAIYGARGAFGVILVTTKRGKQGEVKVNYSNNFGWTTPTTRTDYISDPYLYGKTVDDALWGYNGTTYTGYVEDDWETIKKVADGEMEPFHEIMPNGNAKFFYKTNWYDYLFRKWTSTQNHNISISGGTEKIKGYLSGRYFKTGTIENIADGHLIRYNLNANLSFKVNNWLEISDKIQLSTDDDLTYGGYKGGWYDLFNSSVTMYFLFPFEPNFINGTPFDKNGAGAGAALESEAYWRRYYNEQFINTFSAILTPIKDLVVNFDYSNKIYHSANTTRLTNFDYMTGPKILAQTVGLNRLTESRNRNYYNAMNLYGTYTKNIGENHHFKLLAGYNQEEYESDNVLGEQGDLLVPNLTSLSLGTNLLRATGSASIWAIQGAFGRFNYDYKDRYLLEVNTRYDGSSRFPAESRWGLFPSVSAGWRISREKFWEPMQDVVNSLMLRSSYGKLGNQSVGLYTFAQTLSNSLTSWLVNGNKLNYVSVPAPLPSVVSWEETSTLGFGADFGFLKNKLKASFDWYEKQTTGMYLPGEPLPAVFGASEPKENIAGLSNKGFEFSLGYNTQLNVKGSPMKIKASLSVSNFVAKITKYPNPEGVMSDYWEGQRLGEIWGYHIDGQFQSDEEAQAYQASFANPTKDLAQVYKYVVNTVQNKEWKGLKAGDVKYIDSDGDGEISKGNYTLEDHGDLQVIGNALPQFPFGFNVAADWKGFDISIAGAGVMHQDWYPNGDLFWGFYQRPYLSFIRKDLLDEAWSPENPGGKYPQKYRGYVALGANRSLGEANDYYLTNVGYLRVKNLTIGYTIPKRITQKAHIENLRVYFSGENILTWSFGNLTRYMDPEQAGSGINFSDPNDAVKMNTGDEWSDYPLGKTFSFGINVTL